MLFEGYDVNNIFFESHHEMSIPPVLLLQHLALTSGRLWNVGNERVRRGTSLIMLDEKDVYH